MEQLERCCSLGSILQEMVAGLAMMPGARINLAVTSIGWRCRFSITPSTLALSPPANCRRYGSNRTQSARHFSSSSS
ncbi:MAG: hypothetical protein CM1200mP2_46740 [Planctomycetaceae bacterium]|nr:MAG: hypothetical protein CM1200mP2_46740 [Planctomycetaceae bacterium]